MIPFFNQSLIKCPRIQCFVNTALTRKPVAVNVKQHLKKRKAISKLLPNFDKLCKLIPLTGFGKVAYFSILGGVVLLSK